MSKLNTSVLTEEEIEEELINNDLINCGGVENQTDLHRMDLEEKKNLLHSIKQSIKEDCQKETGSSSRTLKKPIIIDTSSDEFPTLGFQTGSSSRTLKKPIIIDTSSDEFPTLAAAAKSNKLKLPRKPPSKTDTDDSQDHCISLIDDDDESLFTVSKKFSLPFCISDNAPPLSVPNRTVIRDKCPYYQRKGELTIEALRRIITHHDAWKDKYIAETRKLETRALVENIKDFEDNQPKSEENGDSENDPYTFKEVKMYSGPATKKRETNKSSDNVQSPNNRTPQRRASRDSDCEEIQPILKPEEPKLGEWMTAPRMRNKRNRKQTFNQERAQSQPEVEFDFGNRSLWASGRSGGPQSPAPSRRSLPMSSVSEVQEEKVQCPICQREFTLSTVENHAATCEGFSSSPMDVEEEA